MFGENNMYLKQIREYAFDHYDENGWDFVAECWSDVDIVYSTRHAKNFDEAVEFILQEIKPLDSHRKEIQCM